jgi:hypothetical protein
VSINEVYIPIVLFICVAGVIIMHLASRHRERLTMIEKGLSAEDIKTLFAREERRDNSLGVLKWGILAIFIGGALLLGNYLDSVYRLSDGIIIGMVTLFGGVGLVFFYVIASKKRNS